MYAKFTFSHKENILKKYYDVFMYLLVRGLSACLSLLNYAHFCSGRVRESPHCCIFAFALAFPNRILKYLGDDANGTGLTLSLPC